MNAKFNVNKEPNNSYKVDVTVDQPTVKNYLDEALKHEAENFEMKGFRKGTAPLTKVKEMIDPTKIRSHALNHLIPEIYKQLINEHKFAPIIGPRIELKEFEEDKELSLTITIVERPEIKLGDYKKALAELKKEKEGKITNGDALNKVLEISTVGIAEIIIQEEVARMMTSLIDQTSKLGISIEEYAEAHKKNLQQIRDEFKASAERTIKADFLITDIAAKEGINVTEAEVEETIKIIPDEASRKQFENPEQKLYIQAVMLKAKALEKLVAIAEGDSAKEDKKEAPEANKE